MTRVIRDLQTVGDLAAQAGMACEATAQVLDRLARERLTPGRGDGVRALQRTLGQAQVLIRQVQDGAFADADYLEGQE